jgi:23S rRNA (guanosine2251-2'-O)-methyltransferase
LQQKAESAGVSVERVDSGVIESHVSGNSHGGVIALVGPRKFTTMADLIAQSRLSFVVMLDGIEDPFNFGQAVRALYAAGVDGLVVRPRNWLSAAGIVARASAGASELMPMAVAESALEAAGVFKKHGLTVAAAGKGKATSIYDANLAIPLFLLIGGEKRGITRSFIDQADIQLQIPYRRPFAYSLGAAAAAAVLAYEVMRQRLVVQLRKT